MNPEIVFAFIAGNVTGAVVAIKFGPKILSFVDSVKAIIARVRG